MTMCNLSHASTFRGRPIQWNRESGRNPQASGVYLTRDSQGQTWFKYFEANRGRWCMSGAEIKVNAPRRAAVIASAELPTLVAAWATC